jgi:hypothetical protein
MQHQLFRIGSPSLVNESQLQKTPGFDALFDGYHEFVYIPKFDPWLCLNGTWMGALAYVMNDTSEWINVFVHIRIFLNFSQHF